MAIASRRRTEACYAGQRAAAFRKAEDILRPVVDPVPISLRTITPETLAAFDAEWRDCLERLFPWPWRDMAGDYRRNEPTRFQVAVWSGGVLCGLALGKLRSGYCSADYIEGAPVPAHPLRGRVISVVLTALTAYAVALDRPEVRLINPLPALVPRYQALGFVLATPRGGTPILPEGNHMNTKVLRPADLTRSTRRVANKPVSPEVKATASGAADRLDSLEAADMPWLSKAGQTVLTDAPEVSGPPAYNKPAGWQ